MKKHQRGILFSSWETINFKNIKRKLCIKDSISGYWIQVMLCFWNIGTVIYFWGEIWVFEHSFDLFGVLLSNENSILATRTIHNFPIPRDNRLLRCEATSLLKRPCGWYILQHAHTRYILMDHCFLGLIQVDGTEVTCQVTSQKSVTCDVGYPALKRTQQVQFAFPQTHPNPSSALVLIHQHTISFMTYHHLIGITK